MHAPFDSTDSSFFFQTNYTNMSKVLCLTSAVYTNILVTSLIALKTETHTNDHVTPSSTVYCLPSTATGNRVRLPLAQS